MKVIRVLAIIKIAVIIFSFIMIVNYSGDTNIYAESRVLLYQLFIILSTILLVFDTYIACVVYFTNKSMEQLKKVAFITVLVFLMSLFLVNLSGIFFGSFIISFGVLLYIGLVSVTVLILRRIKNVVV